nr:N-acetyltransferase [Escherichia coli]UJL15241.1 N-acetyltransferase [Escherichia coli]
MEIREGHNKFYINDEQGKQIAEIVFVPTGENLAIIEHTDVDESLKGQGIGKQLVAKVVEKMRREKRKLSHYAHLRNTNLIKYGSMMIFAVEKMICVRRK